MVGEIPIERSAQPILLLLTWTGVDLASIHRWAGGVAAGAVLILISCVSMG